MSLGVMRRETLPCPPRRRIRGDAIACVLLSVLLETEELILQSCNEGGDIEHLIGREVRGLEITQAGCSVRAKMHLHLLMQCHHATLRCTGKLLALYLLP
jgi:hypothetical protein